MFRGGDRDIGDVWEGRFGGTITRWEGLRRSLYRFPIFLRGKAEARKTS